MSRPVVGIVCDAERIGQHLFHCVGEKYILPVTGIVEALPWLIPVLPEPLDPDALLPVLDGLLLPGALSNVDPAHYGGEPARPGTKQDPQRDRTALALIPRAIALGVPLLAICRGFQELNVALGGSLHQHLADVPGRQDHREDPDAPLARQYAPRHPVHLAPDGLLAQWLGVERIMVNSLHAQGIRDLAPSLAVEATAEDGTVEAVRVRGARTFAIGVQWHPEWEADSIPHHRELFRRFAAAVRARHHARRQADAGKEKAS
ncbi:MAG: gamma-glutamyl-gamma-aminobutyrate hydrolase family protein [Alphaproteobacteria bacterium]|nr:MAG: gamma-glutamyl-gamma-aminobutyrate hydrolase family protein [Alphaproteobacteria bacterium]